MTLAYFKISKVSFAALQNVETAWDVPMPKPTFFKYTTIRSALNGSRLAAGFPYIIWDWNVIKKPSYETIRTFCPYASVPVWLYSPDEAPLVRDVSNYRWWKGEMLFPEPGSFQTAGNAVFPFRVQFVSLIELDSDGEPI